MHRLNRDCVPKPECLCNIDAERTYSQLRGDEKEQIRQQLLVLQGGCCAYCERRTGSDRDDGHIEHFRKQADHADLTLDWNNLFWSCNDEKTCGKKKDKCEKGIGRFAKFVEDDLVNPCLDEPESFLHFVSDGDVRPREGLNETDLRRAAETIRVFGLDSSSYLKKARHDAMNAYIDILNSLSAEGSSLFRSFVEASISNLRDKPHSTAVRHFLKNFIS